MSNFPEKSPNSINRKSFLERKVEANLTRSKYPGHIPIIMRPARSSSKFRDVPEQRFLEDCNTTVGQFYANFRRKQKLKPEEAIYFTVRNTIPSLSVTLDLLYEELKEEDDFIYFYYCEDYAYGGIEAPPNAKNCK